MTAFGESEHIARKRHKCCACETWVKPGERYVRWAGLCDGEFSTAVYHCDCREAEIAFNKICDIGEWVNLGDMESDDHDWLIDAHPSVAQRFGLTMFRWREPSYSYHWAFNPKASPFYWTDPVPTVDAS
jgi:hypothetical protein